MPSSLQDPKTIDELLLFRLSRLLAAGGAPVIRLCEGRLGITWREWRVIASLRPGVSMRSSKLAQHTRLDRPRTSKCISSLVAKGLIDRRLEPGDKRQATVTLTEKGQQLYQDFFPVVVQLNAQLTQGLSPDELAVLDKAITDHPATGRCHSGRGRLAQSQSAAARRRRRPGSTFDRSFFAKNSNKNRIIPAPDGHIKLSTR